MSYDDMDAYFYQKQAIGQRFKQFRQLLGISRKEMEKEANEPMIQEQRIKLLEKGTFIPDILFIQYFTEEYGLNLTWLVKGIGPIFFKKGPKTPGNIKMKKIREQQKGGQNGQL